jgi:hypothetical protein
MLTEPFKYIHRVRYSSAQATFTLEGKLIPPVQVGSGFLSVDSTPDRVLIERWRPMDNSADRARLFNIDRPVLIGDQDPGRAQLKQPGPLWLDDHDFTCCAVLIRSPAFEGAQPAALVQRHGANPCIRIDLVEGTHRLGINGTCLELLHQHLLALPLSP